MNFAKRYPTSTQAANLTLVGAATEHEAIDDLVGYPNDSDHVKNNGADATSRYGFETINLPPDVSIVKVVIWARAVVDPPETEISVALKFNSDLTQYGATILNPSDVDFDYVFATYTTNPKTGKPWKKNEVMGTEAITGLEGVFLTLGAPAYCSQLFIEIYYNGGQNRGLKIGHFI